MAASFVFNSTKNILFELGASKKIGGLLKGLGCNNGRTVLFVTDQGILDAHISEHCIAAIKSEGFNVEVYSKVAADPPEDNILNAVEVSKVKDICGVIGFGGGSSMDVAKVVSFLSHPNCNQEIKDIYGIGQCTGLRLPLIQVPTTAGTGSEVTPISIITTGSNEKKGIISPSLLPDWAVIDGELTISLPSHVTAATGIDAMVHAIEAYTSRIKKNPLSDLLAKEGLRLLGKNIKTVVQNGENSQARGEMLLGSMYAGMAFANAPVAAVHALAYPLGTHYHVPHGLSNSLMLPHVLKYNGENENCAKLYQDLSKIIFTEKTSKKMNLSESMDNFVSQTENLIEEIKLPNKLRDVGVENPEKSLPFLASEAMKQTRLLPNNPREVAYDDALKLYKEAY